LGLMDPTEVYVRRTRRLSTACDAIQRV